VGFNGLASGSFEKANNSRIDPQIIGVRALIWSWLIANLSIYRKTKGVKEVIAGGARNSK
jgi:hypothetical protein